MRAELNTGVNAMAGMFPQLMGRIKLTDFITMPEDKFYRLIKDIEDSEVFKKLAWPEDRKTKIISYKRYPNTSLNKKFYEFKEEITSDTKTPDIQNALSENEKAVKLIKRIGQEKFRKYFVSCDEESGLGRIAEDCGITVKEASNILGFVNSIYVLDEFSQPIPQQSKTANKFTAQFTCVAKINQASQTGPEIEFLSLNYFRGRYLIDYKKLNEIKREKLLNGKDLGKTDKLLKKLELINARKTILYQAIMKIAEKQSKYFKTGKNRDMKIFTQRMLASEIGVSAGSISRVLNNKSIKTPWNDEKPLRSFLPNMKQLIKDNIKGMFLKSKNKPDRVIVEDIREKYGFTLARRTICQYRNELEVTAK